jgi:hypothetical protein
MRAREAASQNEALQQTGGECFHAGAGLALHESVGAPITAARTAARTVAVAVACSGLVLSGCAYALHGRTTLEGKPFPDWRADEVRPGQSIAELRSILGEPLEVQQHGTMSTTWRYFEKAYPRGCDTVVLGVRVGQRSTRTVEAIVTIEADTVKDIRLVRDGGDE